MPFGLSHSETGREERVAERVLGVVVDLGPPAGLSAEESAKRGRCRLFKEIGNGVVARWRLGEPVPDGRPGALRFAQLARGGQGAVGLGVDSVAYTGDASERGLARVVGLGSEALGVV